MLTRRDALRLALFTALAGGAASTLQACGSDPAPSRRSNAGEGIELVSSTRERTDGDPAAVPDAVAALHHFAAGLDQHLVVADAPNVAFSPYSAAMALGMTLAGTAGQTRDEIAGVLGTDDPDRFHGGLNALTHHLESLAGSVKRGDGSEAEVELAPANALFGERAMEWADAFLDLLAEEYGAGMNAVDFTSNPQQAIEAINAWTAERTRDRIPEIVGPDAINDLTRMVLVNALYLKAPWEHPFSASATETGDFHLADGSTVQVPMMRDELRGAGFASGDGWQVVQVRYAGNGLAMTLAVPDRGREEELDEAIGRGQFADVLGSLEPQLVELTMPRWTFRSTSPLTTVLQALGMETAFTSAADLSPMTGGENDLQITDVLQEAFIAVDEEGTEAAAATAVVAGATAAPPQPEVVVADRPFRFVIHDLEHNTPLFLGRVGDPSASAD
ncbi:serpin family protein [Nocardioides sp. AE5]|uniref:serpin family protein n=1 Tax=Nocardioides sp. AE5 TaxID=2962573 RepID=UPI002880BE1D|nr:serpin family protein [Nocardioides sp. AE5]MDT0202297.1 serpin family protein [Nocardioides sp. AE5]